MGVGTDARNILEIALTLKKWQLPRWRMGTLENSQILVKSPEADCTAYRNTEQWKRSTQDEGRLLSSFWCAELRCLWTSQVLQLLKAPQIWVQPERHPRWRFRFKQWHTIDTVGRVRAWRDRGRRKEETPAKTDARAPRISVGTLFLMVWVEKQLSFRMLTEVNVGIRASVLDRISALTET